VPIAKDYDFTFGVLHSRIHEAWARRVGTQLRERESGSATHPVPLSAPRSFLSPQSFDLLFPIE